MSSDTLENVEKLRRGFDLNSRIGVTQLGRETEWRRALKKNTTMEVLDRNKTVGVLLSPEAYESLLTYLDSVDKELEQAQVENLYGNRSIENNTSGEKLATQAKDSFLARQESIRNFLDDD